MSTAHPMAHHLVGSVLEGSYRIEGLLGEGGMGAVYSATHLRLDKRVAVKVMAREMSAAPEALVRFRREALVTGNLGHPNIVQVFDFGTTPTGEPFLVMEFLDGEDLEHRLRREKRLSPPATLHIVKQVAAALMATHSKGIVHRDLKPGNIYLLGAAGAADFVKVLDFGISKVHSASIKLTKTSSIMGTPAYMSPEQAEGKVDDIDERTDQWALACIAWECLCGDGPFQGDSIPAILLQVVSRQPASLLPKVAGLHPQVEDVLLRALAKHKQDRFANVADFAEALGAAMTGAVSTSVPSVARTLVASETGSDVGQKGRQPGPTTFSRTAGELDQEDDLASVRSRSWIWAVAVAAAVLLVAGGFLLFRPGKSASPSAAAPPVVLPAVAPAVVPVPAPVAPAAAPVTAPAAPVVPVVSPPPAAPKPTRTKPARPRGERRMIEDL